MDKLRSNLPVLAWLYGLAGLIPFVGCAAADIAGVMPGHAWWRLALLTYGAIILSFLGGGRWGLELAQVPVRARVIALSMAPSIIGFFLVLTPASHWRLALGGVAIAHVLQALWDIRGSGAPHGYGRLRLTLTSGAVLSILAAIAFG